MDRRRVLAGGAAVFTAITGGCTVFDTDERDGVILTHVELGNASDEPQPFDVLVIHNDEIVHWSSHEVEAEAVIELDAPDERGRVDVHVRVGTEWASTDFETDEYDGERVIAVITYGMVEDDLLRISRRLSDRSTPAEE